jgi:hypothetical protein
MKKLTPVKLQGLLRGGHSEVGWIGGAVLDQRLEPEGIDIPL